MPFDPSLPVNKAKIVAAELRSQFTGLFDLIQTIPVGPQGPAGTSVSGAVVDGVTTVPAGGAATAGASFDGTNVRFTFGLPRGEVGETGAPGGVGPRGLQGEVGPPFTSFVADPPTTLPAGAEATVSVSFDGTSGHLALGIPRGADGGPGRPGEVSTAPLETAVAGTARNPSGITAYSPSNIGDPPTQAQMQALAEKVNELLNALQRP